MNIVNVNNLRLIDRVIISGFIFNVVDDCVFCGFRMETSLYVTFCIFDKNVCSIVGDEVNDGVILVFVIIFCILVLEVIYFNMLSMDLSVWRIVFLYFVSLLIGL